MLKNIDLEVKQSSKPHSVVLVLCACSHFYMVVLQQSFACQLTPPVPSCRLRYRRQERCWRLHLHARKNPKQLGDNLFLLVFGFWGCSLQCWNWKAIPRRLCQFTFAQLFYFYLYRKLILILNYWSIVCNHEKIAFALVTVTSCCF